MKVEFVWNVWIPVKAVLMVHPIAKVVFLVCILGMECAWKTVLKATMETMVLVFNVNILAWIVHPNRTVYLAILATTYNHLGIIPFVFLLVLFSCILIL